MQANTSIKSTSGAMDVILWADFDDSQAVNQGMNDEINLQAGVSIETNGGLIVMAGGKDDGKNGGTSGDGIPDNYAVRGNGGSLGGVNLGPSNGTGTLVSLLSAGGNILIRGRSDWETSNPRPGIVSQANLKIDAGAGKIEMIGVSGVSHGIEFAWGATPNIAISSSFSGSGPAIRIAGGARDGSMGLRLINNAGGNFLIQSTSTSGGGILLQGQNATNDAGVAINLLPSNSSTNLLILSGKGDIILENTDLNHPRLSTTIRGLIQNFGNIRYGARANTTAVQGITPAVASTNANVIFRAKRVAFETGTPVTNFASTGTFTLEPYTGDNSFTSDVTFRNVDFTTATGLTIGKIENTANITLATDITVNGPISVMGGDVNLNGDITSTAAGDLFFQGLSNSWSLRLASGKTITKTDRKSVV
jgi:hypothetical protein